MNSSEVSGGDGRNNGGRFLEEVNFKPSLKERSEAGGHGGGGGGCQDFLVGGRKEWTK